MIFYRFDEVILEKANKFSIDELIKKLENYVKLEQYEEEVERVIDIDKDLCQKYRILWI